MTETVVVQDETTENTNVVTEVTEFAHKSFQVSLGAVDYAQSEVFTAIEKVQKSLNEFVENTQKGTNDWINELADRGAKVESDGRDWINGFMDNRRKQVDETVSDAQGGLDNRIEGVLHTMNVPSKNDIDALNKKVTTLTRKVNALAKAQKEAAA